MKLFKKVTSIVLAALAMTFSAIPAFAAEPVGGEAEQEAPAYVISVDGKEAVSNLQKTGVARSREQMSAALEESVEAPLYVISVSGEENIAAYKEAGIIRDSTMTRADVQREAEKATRAPSKVWNLYDQGCRTTTYSMSTWIYSGYLYDSGNYRDIWHTVYPNQVQSIAIQCYKENGTTWGPTSEHKNTDDVFVYGIATGSGVNVYFTYKSMDGKLISGSMDIC